MYVKDLREHHLDKIRAYNGSKTIRELTEIFNIENKSTENLRTILETNNIEFKLERKAYPRKSKAHYKGYTKAEQVPGIKLEVGKTYRLKDKDNGNERECIYQGEIVKEYERYYLGITKAGYGFTIHKYPTCYEFKEI